MTDRAERRFGRRKKSCQVRVQFTAVHVHSHRPTRPPRQCLAAPPRRAWRTSRSGNRRTSPRRRRRCSSSRTCGRRGWTSARARSWCARAVRPSVRSFVRAPPSSSSSRSTPSVVPPARSLRPDDALSSAISPSSRPSQLKEALREEHATQTASTAERHATELSEGMDAKCKRKKSRARGVVPAHRRPFVLAGGGSTGGGSARGVRRPSGA